MKTGDIEGKGIIEGDSLVLASGATIDEFSTDATLSSNSDTKIPTQKAVKAYVDAKALGAWVDKSSSYAAQAATTDGFVVLDFYVQDGGSGILDFIGYSDGNADPTTKRNGATFHFAADTSGKNGNQGFTMPVRSGDYWKVLRTTSGTISGEALTVYWIPFGA